MENNISRFLLAFAVPLPFSLIVVAVLTSTVSSFGFYGGGHPQPTLVEAAEGAPEPPSAPSPVEVPATATPSDTETAAIDMGTVAELKDSTEDQAEQLDGMQHFLEDRLKAKQGKAPRRWQQPPLEAYSREGAPESFLPAP